MNRWNWSESDEAHLLEVCSDLQPLLDIYTEAGSKKSEWWGAVSGAMLARHGVTASPGACETRWQDIQRRQRERAEALAHDAECRPNDDLWERTAKRIADYEAEAWDWTEARLAKIEHMLGRVLEELGVDPQEWSR